MSKTFTSRGLMAAGAASAALIGATAASAQARPPEAQTPIDAILQGQPIFEVRARSESVDQHKAGAITEDAQAYTVRTRLGWSTAAWNGLSGLVEAENVQHLGSEDFAVNVPGAATPPLNGAAKARFPLVNGGLRVTLAVVRL